MQGPGCIAEVALELAHDGRNGKRAEREAPVGVESLDGLDETETRHLEKILVGLAGLCVPPGKLARQGQKPGNQLVPGFTVPVRTPALE